MLLKFGPLFSLRGPFVVLRTGHTGNKDCIGTSYRFQIRQNGVEEKRYAYMNDFDTLSHRF